jgi:hypothetical protein
MPDPVSFDLQAHSVHSDGTLPAAEVVERAAAAGVELFALTDHDTIDGVPEAAAKARELGLDFGRVEMPNAEPAFVRVLASLVRRALAVPSEA